MPRRSSTRAVTTTESTVHQSTPSFLPSQTLHEDLVKLRSQWKWAAFSQFFFTFSNLFAMNNVSLTDIEDDLIHSTNTVLPRIMQRLLYTLSYDRKVSLDNWQSSLRKQYYRRDPLANPMTSGPSPNPQGPRSVPDHNTPSPAAEARREDSAHTPIQDESLNAETDAASELVLPSTGDPDHQKLGFLSEESAQQPQSETLKKPLDDREDSHAGADDEGFTNWLDLPMHLKLDSMYLLTEWQFHNPMRLRFLMKSDDETAQWRIEPIGYDAKGNAYWFIGASRLWIQRITPKQPKTSLKRKRPAVGTANTDASAPKPKRQLPSIKQLRNDDTTTPNSQRTKFTTPSVQRFNNNNSSNAGNGVRAAKVRAKLKLDTQAAELARLNKQASVDAGDRSGSEMRSGKRLKDDKLYSHSNIGSSPTRPLGTRMSARLRGTHGDDWQPVPVEWLNEGTVASEINGNIGHVQSSGGVRKTSLKTGLESDDESISDLTELSERSEEREMRVKPDPSKDENEHPDVRMVASVVGEMLNESPMPPKEFTEWETICVTLHEWEHIAERFEKATHFREKSLYKVLVNDIVPIVTEELREIDRKHRLQEALVHRKRSSRIAIKESEKEEARLAARKRADEQEKQSRARRLEARLQREEADRDRRESAREQRRRERETREMLQKENGSESSNLHDSVVGDGPTGNTPLNGNRPFHPGKTPFHGMNGAGAGPRTPLGDDWELDCEVCHRQGINIDDGTPMMCCGICCKWQHIACHDRADIQAGRHKRNWDDVEFFCLQCLSRTASNATGNGCQLEVPVGQDSSTSYSSSRPSIPTEAPLNSPARSFIQRSSDSYPSYDNSDLRPCSQPQSEHYLLPRTTIAFTHYQPHQRGFSSSSELPHNSAQTQSYGQRITGQFTYPDIPTSSQMSNLYQRSVLHTQPGWNVTTPANAPGYGTLYNPSMGHSNSAIDGLEAEQQHSRRLDAGTFLSGHHQWQHPYSNTSPNVGDQPLNTFSATQLSYHPTS